MARTFAWERTGWLPKLAVVDCPLLERHRKAHEAAIEAVAEAEGAGDQFEAIDQLLAVVETAHRELEADFQEQIAPAIDAAAAKVTPEVGEAASTMPLSNDDPRAREQARKEADERAKLRPRRAALDADMQAIARVRGIVTGDGMMLDRGRVLPIVRAQVEERREQLGATATA